ncbi:MAG: rhomboid family intramembrane serine protease [Polyangiaceae bacterium]|nr:rhomboid family intramembrane serine protease [Polyangiaceae bacterium]
MGVSSWVATGPGALVLLMVSDALADRALRELLEYEGENRDRKRTRAIRDRPLYRQTWWSLAIVSCMLAFFFVTGPIKGHSAWFQYGIADSNQILAGSLHRTVTALTLHADAGHVVGNAIVGGVLLSAVHRRFGAGLGSLVVLASGAAGNLMNAAWHGSDHRSLGASTAVMATLGILAVTQLVLNETMRPETRRVVKWAPIVAGLALLGTFGSSPSSDLHAHGFGFLAGALIGLVGAVPLRRRASPLPTWTQALFGSLAVATVVGSWSVAFVLHSA